MNIPIAPLFDEADTHYLKPEELAQVNQYVQGLPERLAAYRDLRDRELEVVQWIADQLEVRHAQEPIESLERRLKNALLLLRNCAMALLLDDPTHTQQVVEWLGHTISHSPNQAIDLTLHQLLNQRLSQKLDPPHWKRLAPLLMQAQAVLLQTPVA